MSFEMLYGATMGLGAIDDALTGIANYKIYRAVGAYQKQMYDQNVILAKMQAENAIERGHKVESAIHRNVRQMHGEQRVNLAAQGIDVDYGVAAQLQTETFHYGMLDTIQARNNAFLEAMGYKMNAQSLASQGALAQASSNYQATSGLLSGFTGGFAKGATGAYHFVNGMPRKQTSGLLDARVYEGDIPANRQQHYKSEFLSWFKETPAFLEPGKTYRDPPKYYS